MAKIKDELMNHDYDGIQEYDNDLPGWWKYLFYFTIIFAFVYLMYYHVLGIGDSSRVEYQKETGTYVASNAERGPLTVYQSPYRGEAESGDVVIRTVEVASSGAVERSAATFEDLLKEAMAKADAEDLAKLEAAFPELYASYASSESPSAGEAANLAATESAPETAPLTDAASLDAGKKIWDVQCFTCHAVDGGGGIGPNMTDEYWIHGGKYDEILHTIRVGVPAKGMIPWEGTLNPQQIHEVASYLLTFQGTIPANPKAPQGEKAGS